MYQKDSAIYVPVDNQKITMRAVLSREELQELLDEIGQIDTIWIANEREREEVGTFIADYIKKKTVSQ